MQEPLLWQVPCRMMANGNNIQLNLFIHLKRNEVQKKKSTAYIREDPTESSYSIRIKTRSEGEIQKQEIVLCV